MTTGVLTKRRTSQKKLSKEQKLENRNRKKFQKQIDNIFVYSGFNSLKVQKHFYLGGKSNELDHCFIYKNVMIICEDTWRPSECQEKDKHILNKQETFRIIKNNREKFIEVLKKTIVKTNIY